MEQKRKKARYADDGIVFNAKKRVQELSSSIHDLIKKYPEAKYIFDLEELPSKIETAVEMYKEDVDAVGRRRLNEVNTPIYTLPNELLRKCISYVGEGNYGIVSLVSTKFHEAHRTEYGYVETYTSYEVATSSVEIVKYCVQELCTNLEEKDDIFIAAAVNGNIDILRYAVSNQYDLFPLLHNKIHSPVYIYSSGRRMIEPIRVDATEIAANGHLHVLKYMKEELNFEFGFDMYCKPAIENGRLEILEWLKSNDFLIEERFCRQNFCGYAIRSGRLDVLTWLHDEGFQIRSNAIEHAILTESIDIIQFCLDNGTGFDMNDDAAKYAIKTGNIEIIRFCYNNDCDFIEGSMYDVEFSKPDSIEIVKFLRSIGHGWPRDIMESIVESDSLELIQYCHENGCPWSEYSEGGDYYSLLVHGFSLETLMYLVDNGCPLLAEYLGFRRSLYRCICGVGDVAVLNALVGKDSTFDNELLEFMLRLRSPWVEGIKLIFEKSNCIESFETVEFVFCACKDFEVIKFARESLALPWTQDSARSNFLLSKIACYVEFEDVKWAYDHGCRGGYVVEDLPPLDENDHTQADEKLYCLLSTNYGYLQEKGIIDLNIQNIVSDILGLISIATGRFDRFDHNFLQFLLKQGYRFDTDDDRRKVSKHFYNKCCRNPSHTNRKMVAFLQQLDSPAYNVTMHRQDST